MAGHQLARGILPESGRLAHERHGQPSVSRQQRRMRGVRQGRQSGIGHRYTPSHRVPRGRP